MEFKDLFSFYDYVMDKIDHATLFQMYKVTVFQTHNLHEFLYKKKKINKVMEEEKEGLREELRNIFPEFQEKKIIMEGKEYDGYDTELYNLTFLSYRFMRQEIYREKAQEYEKREEEKK